MTLAEWVKSNRLKCRATVRYTAECVGVSVTTITKLESGALTNPTVKTLHKLATAFGTKGWRVLRKLDI